VIIVEIEDDFLGKIKRIFGESLKAKILEYIFFKKEISLDSLLLDFANKDRRVIYGVLLWLEKEKWIKHTRYPNNKSFFKLIEK